MKNKMIRKNFKKFRIKVIYLQGINTKNRNKIMNKYNKFNKLKNKKFK